MEDQPLIVGLGGTTRPGSSSEKALAVSLRAAEQSGARTVMIAGPELELPMYAPEKKERSDAARKLVDFLLSAETEMALAQSAARQIPLGPVAEPLPADVEPLATWARAGADLRTLLPARTAVIDWLKSEYLQ